MKKSIKEKTVAMQDFPADLWVWFGATCKMKGVTIRDVVAGLLRHLKENPKFFTQILKQPTHNA